jgi:hypothetical protein
MRTAKAIAFAAILALVFAPAAEAAKRKKQRAATAGYPYSIMNEEPGLRSAAPRYPGVVNPHQSPLTPQGRAPRVDPVRPLGQAASPPTVLPGISGNTGPAIVPARPPGQSFQDRATSCVHAGGTSGVGAGQIGSFTRSCVNQ